MENHQRPSLLLQVGAGRRPSQNDLLWGRGVGPLGHGCFEIGRSGEREAEFEEKRAREEYDAEDRAVSDWFDDVQAVADAAMIAAGFHKHKRQWRRKRI